MGISLFQTLRARGLSHAAAIGDLLGGQPSAPSDPPGLGGVTRDMLSNDLAQRRAKLAPGQDPSAYGDLTLNNNGARQKMMRGAIGSLFGGLGF